MQYYMSKVNSNTFLFLIEVSGFKNDFLDSMLVVKNRV